MKFAIIETGGKQYVVETGKPLTVERLPKEVGETVTFDKVLLLSDGKDVQIGTPYLSGVSIEALISAQGRSRKIRILRYHSKTRHRRRKGHRQHFTKVSINKVG